MNTSAAAFAPERSTALHAALEESLSVASAPVPKVGGWSRHTWRGRIVLLVLWAVVVLVGVFTVGVVVAALTGPEPPSVASVIVAVIVLATVCLLHSRAALGFSRFRPWAWWYVVVFHTLGLLFGILASVTSKSEERSGPVLIGLLSFTTLLAVVIARSRYQRGARMAAGRR